MMKTAPTYRRGRDYYSSSLDRGGLAGVFSILLVIVFLCIPPALVYVSEIEHFDVVSSLQELLEQHPIQPFTSKATLDDVLHFHANVSSAVVEDKKMSVVVVGALKLRRVTEYCQWQQFQSTSCETCTREVRAKDGSTSNETYECNCITSYSYVKAWRSHRINSGFFDQPGAHNNPQRDPMPSGDLYAQEATVEDLEEHQTAVLDKTILRNARGNFRQVNWNLHGVQPKRAWWNRWMKDTTRYEGIHELKDTNKAPAAVNDHFVYVGDGYFFSPYEESRSNKLFKYLMEYMEGSIFDWQLGDLMPSCTAGDVRFYYQVMDPTTVSVVGQVKEKRPEVHLGSIQTSTRDVGLVHEGTHEVREMFKAEERGSWWEAMLPRILLVPWSAAMMNLLFSFFGRRVVGLDVVLGSLAVWLGFFGCFWWNLWGRSNECIAYLVTSAALFLWAMGRSVPHTSSGLRAVWCMLGRWARVPPSWRVEGSYEDEGDVYYEKKHQ